MYGEEMQYLAKYCDIIDKTLAREIPPREAAKRYFTFFADDNEVVEGPVYDILESIFEDFDAFTENTDLIPIKPDYYIDEETLRQRLTKAQALLTELLRSG